jgi:hypothetical protein
LCVFFFFFFTNQVAETVRVRCLQQYGFGQFPYSVVFDKVDILGKTAHPLFAYMMGPDGMSNPNGAREKDTHTHTHTTPRNRQVKTNLNSSINSLSLSLRPRRHFAQLREVPPRLHRCRCPALPAQVLRLPNGAVRADGCTDFIPFSDVFLLLCDIGLVWSSSCHLFFFWFRNVIFFSRPLPFRFRVPYVSFICFVSFGFNWRGSDVAALLAGEALPPPPPEFGSAWVDADRESVKSEYAFRVGYNLYKQDRPNKDWLGAEAEGFR